MTPDDAYGELRAAILAGRLQPNERLVEADLVELLGAPRGSIRMALLRLTHDGLVEHERNRGARVRQVSVDEAIDILEARAALEGFAARKAAVNGTRDEVDELSSILGAMRERLDAGDVLGASERNPALHATILRTARHGTIERLVGSLSSQLVRFQYRTILLPGRAEQSYAEHAAVVEAIADADADGAEAAMRVHLDSLRDALMHLAADEAARRSFAQAR